MGFFKNIGKSLKGVTKMISTKNLIKVATGDAKGLLQEAAGRVLSPHMKSEQVEQVQYSDPLVKGDFFVQNQSQAFSNNLQNQIAQSNAGQKVSSFFTMAYLKSMWTQYKTPIIIVGSIATIGIGYLIYKRFGKKKRR